MSPEEPADETVETSRRFGESLVRTWADELNARLHPQHRFGPGDLIACRFAIVRFLGSGGMGEVYEAEDRFLQGTHVALKAILPERAGVPGALIRFEREVLLARQITHPNVCPVYDIVHSQDTPGCPCFIAMKLLSGETLAARLRCSRELDAVEAVSVLRQIVGALRAAHAAGVIHRDLKPGNIMVEGSGADVKAIVTDFGLARDYGPETAVLSDGYVLGTPGYIAPEVLNGHRATPASDLYALGIILHQLLTGKRPASNQKTGLPMLAPELLTMEAPRFAVQLIRACLDVNPSVRYRGFEQALAVLDPGSASSPSAYRSSRSFTRRKALSIGAAAACAIGGAAWWDRNRIENLFEPLPAKRFVALITWPPESNKDTRPILSGVIDAIETELARAEAVDRNFFVICSHEVTTPGSGQIQLSSICDSLGANLVLAASGVFGRQEFRLLLRVLDASTNAVLRSRRVACALSNVSSLPSKAVSAAGELLSISGYRGQDTRLKPSTNSPAAYKAFQTAEDLIQQPNDVGLDEALHKYGEAVSIDPRYALAYAKLAFAYCSLYDVRHDRAALELAQSNGERALKLDNSLVDAHIALSTVFELTGDRQKGLREAAAALSLDPANPRTLNWQATIYQRMGRWADAEQTFHRMIEQRPNNWVAYLQLGWLLGLQGKYRAAINAMRKVTVASPKSAIAYDNLGALYLKVGEFRQATESFDKSLDLKPNGDTYANASTSFRAQGRYLEALPLAQKAANLDPTNDWTWGELGDCYASIPGKQKNAYEAYLRAATEVERQLHTDSRDGAAWMRLAFYRVKCNAHDIVLPLVTKAEQNGATDVESQLAKVRVLETLGKRKDALVTLAAGARKGITKFETGFVPDLRELRKDPGYLQIFSRNSAETKS